MLFNLSYNLRKNESMQCFPSTTLKLKAWNEERKRKLEYALAKKGFVFLKCQEKFQYKHMIKEKIKPRFDKILPRISINDIYYKSFLLRDGDEA